jgi:hypothetical protein
MDPMDRVIAALRDRFKYVLISLLLLTPCYWQPRLQAGDLSSHIYNAWLAQLIESGRADGLTIVRQTTNVLFDLMLSGLFRVFGVEWSQRIAVSIAVLTFAWGAFAFVSVVAGRRAWHLLPCIAMLAYGWVFHMGFFNFYLSMGLCFWAMRLAWQVSGRRLALAAPLLLLAYVAHALPVVWTGGLLTYIVIARRLTPVRRAYLTAAFVLAISGVHVVVARLMLTHWSASQLAISSGVDQMWVFDGKYYIVLAGLLAVWTLLFLTLIRRCGAREVVGGVPFQLCVIGAATVFILPGTVLLPGFSHALAYIAERMSLGVAVCVCAMLAAVPPRMLERYALVLVAVVFFGLVYRDERALNAFEDRMQDVVSTIPRGERIVNSIQDPWLRTNPVAHMIDRVCVGRCFSYANYEASTKQFRIRATAPNSIVAATYSDSWHLQSGDYLVRERDLPLYTVDVDAGGHLWIKLLKSGVRNGTTEWSVFGNKRLAISN